MGDDQEIDLGDPIAALAQFEEDTSSDLIVRTRHDIQRRTIVAQLTSFAATMPLIVIREFWLVFRHNSVR
jgi:hypothetical protein